MLLRVRFVSALDLLLQVFDRSVDIADGALGLFAFLLLRFELTFELDKGEC